MSLRATLRATPALFRAATQEAVAYRAELVVWILSTTLPLVMLALFSAVAREGPLGRYGSGEVQLYFLSVFVVRQVTGSWVSWQLIEEIREGRLSMRLLKPVSPLVSYALENLAAMPLRFVVSLPVALFALFGVGWGRIPSDPLLWVMFCASLLGAWLLTFLSNVALGSASFFWESSRSLIDVWLVLYFILSGYTIPVDLFPIWLQKITIWLPFRYQMAFPVEILSGQLGREAALLGLAEQWGMVALLWGGSVLFWRRGLRRFEAYGG